MSLTLISLLTLHVLFACLTRSFHPRRLLHIVSIPASLLHLLQKRTPPMKFNWTDIVSSVFLCVFLKSVTDSSRCKRREEQECFRLANCRSCSLNTNCQWEMQQQECQALPGEEAHPENEHARSLSHTFWCITVGPYFRKKNMHSSYIVVCFS